MITTDAERMNKEKVDKAATGWLAVSAEEIQVVLNELGPLDTPEKVLDGINKLRLNLINLYCTIIDKDGQIAKVFVTIVHPPKDFPGGIPKHLMTTKGPLSEEEISVCIDKMAELNARWMYDQMAAGRTDLVESRTGAELIKLEKAK